MSESSSPIHVTCIGLEEPVLLTLKGFLQGCHLLKERFKEDQLTVASSPFPHVVLCGPPPEGVPIVAVAQKLRKTYREIPIYFVSETKPNVERKALIKTGFTDQFFLPLDLDPMKKALGLHFAKVSRGEIKSYCPVKLIDIEPGATLDFDLWIYLRQNRKYLKYRLAGDGLEFAKIEKFLKKNMRAVYVSADQMENFYAYTAKQFQSIENEPQLSQTEKLEKIQEGVRDILSSFFNTASGIRDLEQGDQLMKECRGIVRNFILAKEGTDIYAKLIESAGGDANSYNHASNVSTFAALFSLGLGIGNPSDLAFGGLFHDIGLAEIPASILGKNESEWSPRDRNLYQRHPEFSVSLLQRKRLGLPKIVAKMIQQHHECHNGSGYPAGCVGKQICPEAQVLALADRFDEMTSAVEGKALKSPHEAVEYFKAQLSRGNSGHEFDPEILKALLNLFPKKEPFG